MLLSAMQKGHFPFKKGTFLLKRALFLITLKVGGARAPSAPPPSYAPAF